MTGGRWHSPVGRRAEKIGVQLRQFFIENESGSALGAFDLYHRTAPWVVPCQPLATWPLLRLVKLSVPTGTPGRLPQGQRFRRLWFVGKGGFS